MLAVRTYLLAFAACVCAPACHADEAASGAPAAGSAATKKTPAEIAPEAGTLWSGHVALYREGWRAISSTEQAFRYAREHAVTASGQALAEAQADIRRDSADYGAGLQQSAGRGAQLAKEVYAGGSKVSRATVGAAGGLAGLEWDYGSAAMAAAWGRVYRGYMTLGPRTADDRRALSRVRWYQGLNDDFSNLNALTDAALGNATPHIRVEWGKAYDEARSEFDAAYQVSGTRDNSLSGVGDLVTGYAHALYSGLLAPASETAVQGAEVAADKTTRAAAKLVFLPTTKLLMIGGRTVEATGLTLYYTTSLGYTLVSPTVEGGLLGGVSLLTLASIPPTAAAGGAAGLVNQVAVTLAAPVAGTGVATAHAASDTAVYAAQLSYDLARGSTRVAINTGKSGVALGYNAISAIPAQLVLAGSDAMLLVIDGTRLSIATVRGDVDWSGPHGEKHAVPVQSLPVGSVVDVNALSREPGVELKVISDDPAVVKKVLEKLPDDLREKEQRP